MNARFPYFYTHASHMGLNADFQGQLINEPLLGSFFAYNLIGLYLAALADQRISNDLKNKGLLAFTVLTIAFGVIIAAVDIQMVGMTLRYLTDFSLFIMLAVICIILVFVEKSAIGEEHIYSSWQSLAIIPSLWTIALNYITLIAAGRYSDLAGVNPLLFYQIKYLFFVR